MDMRRCPCRRERRPPPGAGLVLAGALGLAGSGLAIAVWIAGGAWGWAVLTWLLAGPAGLALGLIAGLWPAASKAARTGGTAIPRAAPAPRRHE